MTLEQLFEERDRLIAIHNEKSEALIAINSQLEEHKAFGTVRGKPVTRDWFIKATDARGHNVRQIQEVEIELSKVRQNIAQAKRGSDDESNIFRAFFEAASEYLPGEVFAQIMKNASRLQS